VNSLWVSAAGNGVVALAYFAITGAIAIPLLRSGQWWSNRLGSATAAIFFTCAVGHGLHLLHAVDGSGDTNASWHLAVWDLLSAVVAVYYWSLRKIYGSLMDGAKLFEDLQEQARLERAQAAQELAEARLERAREVEQALTEARDAALASAAARSSFLATMSHEIRTPINAVIGLTGLLLQTPLDDHQRDLLETVRTSGDALLDVVNDVLDFSKIESGEVRMELRPFDVSVAVDNAVDLVASAAALKGLDLVTHVSPTVPAYAVGDVTRFRQVLLNLLSNAVKFTETGHVRLAVSAEPDGAGHLVLTAAVTDTGIGIPGDALARLFDPFTQVDASHTRLYGGTGLGLAISHRLAAAMDGDITVTSAPGAGSTFTMTVRVGRVSTEPEPRWWPVRGRSALVVGPPGVFRDHLAAQLADWDLACSVVDDLHGALLLANRGGSWDVALVPATQAAEHASDAAALAAGVAPGGPLPMVALTSLEAGLGPLDRSLFRAELAMPVRVGALADVLVGLLAPQALVPGQRSVPELGEALPALRILLVEDNAVNQKVGRLLLRSLGQEDVEIAGNGREAVAAAAARPFDLVLMDIQMPELDGLGATRQIRELDLPWPQPRIIALTAAASGADRQACSAAGMDDYVAKPIRVDALLAAMRGITPGAVPAARSAKEATVLDREVLRALLDQLGRTEDTATDLVAEFLNDLAANVARLRAALVAGDQDTVARTAHEIRPTCALFGAAEFTALLAALESGTRTPDAPDRVEAAFDRLRAAFGVDPVTAGVTS
jgi:signal transduction histidine kinase/CheY-like chemotaxis protein/HPt (histidine-containing phosphotransfer) domain-containing protein